MLVVRMRFSLNKRVWTVFLKVEKHWDTLFTPQCTDSYVNPKSKLLWTNTLCVGLATPMILASEVHDFCMKFRLILRPEVESNQNAIKLVFSSASARWHEKRKIKIHLHQVRGVMRGAMGGTTSRAPTMGAPNHCGGDENPNNVTNTFLNTVNLLPKEFMFEHGGAKLASCPGRHLTSLSPLHQV